MKTFDVVVVGGGPGGLDAAYKLKGAGKSVCVVNYSRQWLGGVCLNKGCMPTKGLLKRASILRNAKKSESFGLDINVGDVNLGKIKESVFEGIGMLSAGIGMMTDQSGVDTVYGKGSFSGKNEIKVEKDDGSVEFVKGEKIIIATGSVTRELPFAPFDGKYIVSSDDMLVNTDLPEKLLIIGGGAIGCEFATMYNSFGSKVKLVEALDSLLPNDDKLATATLKEKYEEAGIEVGVSVMAESIEVVNDKVEVKFKGGDKETFDKVLVAIGRKPAVDGLNLEVAGVELENGAVKVDEYLKTSNPDVFAVGDAIGGWMFAHSAGYEGGVAASNILNENSCTLDERAVPRVVFSNPEFASIGVTEASEDVKELYIPGIMKGRPIVDKTDIGMMKIFVYKKDNTIAGACMIGEVVTEIIHEIGIAVQNRLTVNQLMQTMYAHPTYGEPIPYIAATGI
jgi:dihydrolipoamide dehydrogenase